MSVRYLLDDSMADEDMQSHERVSNFPREMIEAVVFMGI